MQFVRGNPDKEEGKAIFYIKDSLTGEIYALFSSKDELELRIKLKNTFEFIKDEINPEKILEKKEKNLFGIYWPNYLLMINEEKIHSPEYKDFDLIYCGEIEVNQVDDLHGVFSSAVQSYSDIYKKQKRIKEPTINQILQLNSQLRNVFYEDSYKNYNSVDLRKRLHSHMACLLDSITFNRKEDLENRLFYIKVFFKRFPCPSIISKLLEFSQQKMPTKRKNKVLSLFVDEIVAVKEENYETAEKIRNKLKRFQGN